MKKQIFDTNTTAGRSTFDVSSLLLRIFGFLRGRIIKRQERGSMVER